MNLMHLNAFLGEQGAPFDSVSNPRAALLHNFRLRTNYVSTTHQAGACNIEPADGCLVEGVLMEITPVVRDALRVKEGFPKRYTELMVTVLDFSCFSHVSAMTYVVSEAHQVDDDVLVTEAYRANVLRGAKLWGLTRAYQDELRKTLQSKATATDSELR